MKKKGKILTKKCNLKWSIFDSEYILKTPWIIVRKDTVLTSKNILINDFYVLEYPLWVNVIARTIDGKYIIERQYRHGIKMIVFELCAGICEKGEKPLDAAKRELREETGYSGGTWSFLGKFAPNPNSMNNWSYTYYADGVVLQGVPKQDSTEDIEIFEISQIELLDLMLTGQIVEGIMLASLWHYFYKIKIQHKNGL